MVGDHGGARAGRHHHVFGIAEDLEEMAGDLAGFLAIAGVESGLAAAGLILGKIDRVAEALQHAGHGEADCGEELIDHAGDEDRDPLRHEEGL